jgi:hypothetical protein
MNCTLDRSPPAARIALLAEVICGLLLTTT